MQLQDHDSLFGPRRPWKKLGQLLTWLPFIPALIVWSIPSFQIGTTIFRKPQFEIPVKLSARGLFTLPAAEDMLFPQAAGHAMTLIEKPEPMYLGVAADAGMTEISFVYREARHLSLKTFLPRFDHPHTAIFVQQVPVEAAEQKPARAIASADMSKEQSLFRRSDGFSNLACWSEPQMAPYVDLKPMMTIRVNRNAPKIATMTVAGPGEVTHIGPSANSQQTLIVYHGGGLYSRYYDLKDLKVHKGDKVKAGQVVATMLAGTRRDPASIQWDTRLSNREVNLESLLEVSSRLCGSK
jgi:hypothetical protein